MKRTLTTLGLTLTFCMATVGTALAKKYPPHPNKPHVAFTGADVSLGVVLFAALMVLGVASLVLARRRAGAAA